MKILLAFALSLFAVKSYGQTYVSLISNTNPISYSIPKNNVAMITSTTQNAYLAGTTTITVKNGMAPETLITVGDYPLPITGPATITLYNPQANYKTICTLEVIPQSKEQTYVSLVATNTNPVSYFIPTNRVATIFPLAGLYPTIEIGTTTETNVLDGLTSGQGKFQVAGPATITVYGSTNTNYETTICTLKIIPVKKTVVITQ